MEFRNSAEIVLSAAKSCPMRSTKSEVKMYFLYHIFVCGEAYQKLLIELRGLGEKITTVGQC